MDLLAGRTRVGELVEPGALWSKQHFPKLLAMIALTAGTAGNMFMSHLRQNDQEYQRRKREKERESALEAAMQVPAFGNFHSLD